MPLKLPFLRDGTFSSGSKCNTANTTENAAKGVWHVVQAFLSAFPEYEKSAQHLHVFGESYGGRYAPSIVEHILEQNSKIQNMQLDPSLTHSLQVKSLGIVNGAVDLLADMTTKVRYAVNNTYDHDLFLNFPGLENYLRKNPHTKDEIPEDFSDLNDYLRNNTRINNLLPDFSGLLEKSINRVCVPLVGQCTFAASKLDPRGYGNRPGVNNICAEALVKCKQFESLYRVTKLSDYDIAESYYDPFPSRNWIEYLNQPRVLHALGSPVNFTHSNKNVWIKFVETGDMARGTIIPKIADFLKKGIRVGLMYGDRDFICQWFGGEETSLQIAKQVSLELGSDFASAGYAPIVVNESYIGGDVRQYGNLSFSRIFQAGHALPAYQPETAFQVFERIMSGKSVSMGEPIDLSTFSTRGQPSSDHHDILPEKSEPVCFIRDFENTCDPTDKTRADFEDGVVINGVWYASAEDWPLYKRPRLPLPPQVTLKHPMKGSFTATNVPDVLEVRDLRGDGVRSRVPGCFLMFAVVTACLLTLNWL